MQPNIHTLVKLTNVTKYIFKPDSTPSIPSLQDCISDIRSWMLADRLKLNDGKTEFIIIGTRAQLDQRLMCLKLWLAKQTCQL